MIDPVPMDLAAASTLGVDQSVPDFAQSDLPADSTVAIESPTPDFATYDLEF